MHTKPQINNHRIVTGQLKEIETPSMLSILKEISSQFDESSISYNN